MHQRNSRMSATLWSVRQRFGKTWFCLELLFWVVPVAAVCTVQFLVDSAADAIGLRKKKVVRPIS